MEKIGLYDAMLSGLNDVHLSVRARKQAECYMRRAAAIIELLVGKSPAECARAHAVATESVVVHDLPELRERAAA
ncbi:MAG TPA: hypothetical protein VGP15_11645 [Burkholderiales bacterium]|jgi:hypothetical protein|nr:hypothetical protein [Burkholderiales bacterium]